MGARGIRTAHNAGQMRWAFGRAVYTTHWRLIQVKLFSKTRTNTIGVRLATRTDTCGFLYGTEKGPETRTNAKSSSLRFVCTRFCSDVSYDSPMSGGSTMAVPRKPSK